MSKLTIDKLNEHLFEAIEMLKITAIRMHRQMKR